MALNRLRAFYASRINRSLVKFLILITAIGISLAVMVFPVSSRPAYYPLKAGDVAPQDIQAPAAITYPSEVLTEQMRQDAEEQVGSVYMPADSGIARKQIEMLRSALNYITEVRADTFALPDQQLADLSALENIQLTRADADQILALSDTRWQMASQESLSVLEQVLRDTIREDQLKDAQRRVPTLISFSLPQDLAGLVTDLVTPFVVPNSLFSPEMTTLARQEARNRVEIVTRTFAAGEIIVRRGQVVTPAQIEALNRFGLILKPSTLHDWLSSGALALVLGAFSAMYFFHRRTSSNESLRSLALIALTFLVFLFSARAINANRTVIPYGFPIPAFGLTIACLFNAELGMVLSLVLSLLTAFGMTNGMDLSVYYILTSLFGILILGKGHRTANFILAGIGIGAIGSASVLAYRMAESNTDVLGVLTITAAAFFNGIVSASLTLLLQYLLAQLLGLTTALQLLEISRPDHPLQQFIITNAPGSYQHSLQVAIMAEQAAERIGADALLVRVGAIYHDVGKALNPSFFIENQVPGKLNPHDDLDPAVSARTIIRHVPDGAVLAKKHHMPSRIIDFINEHHGTLITRYQYAKALEQAGNARDRIDESQFRYPGPRPQSRETALLMIADGCQARARAEIPQDEEQIRATVRKVIDFCQREGQLDDTRLTLSDLNQITESFVCTLTNTYHPRIRYPDFSEAKQALPEPQENLEHSLEKLPENKAQPDKQVAPEPLLFTQVDTEVNIPPLPAEDSGIAAQLFKTPAKR